MVKLNKKENLLRWLEGQRRAQEFIERERREWFRTLRHMTPTERLKRCESLFGPPRLRTKGHQRALDSLKLEEMQYLIGRLQRAQRKSGNE